MTRGIFGDDARFRATYWERFPGMYFAGDGARIDEDGDFWLLGRVDDVMNVSGHRISTIEVESALVDHPSVAEAAVCGRADQLTGQAIVAFVTLKGSEEASVEMLEVLRNHVAQKIGPIAKPANIVFTPELPKTRSGKIMRRLLRDVAEDRPLGDTTTLADPAVVAEIADRAVAQPSRGVASFCLDGVGPVAAVRPGPVVDAAGEPCPDRVRQNIRAGFEQVLLALDHPRRETLGEDVTESAVPLVEAAWRKARSGDGRRDERLSRCGFDARGGKCVPIRQNA